MEIRIGVQNVTRELVIDSEETAETVIEAIEAALAAGTVLALQDSRGRRVVVPTSTLAYVEVGVDTPRKVGFLGA